MDYRQSLLNLNYNNIIMTARNSVSRYQELRGIINVNNILSKKIQPDMLRRYVNVLNLLQTYLFLHARQQPTFIIIIKDLFRIIQEENIGLSMNFVLKKLIFLQFLIKWGCEHQLLAQNSAQILQIQIKLTIKQDLPKLFGRQGKKMSSLDKITTFFREFSLSKQKNSSKMKMQQPNKKQTLQQIVTKVLEPYCCYLLKVLNDHETYRAILIRDQSTKTATFMWKLINWNAILSKIIYNLHKVGRYFLQDFIGFWVVSCYVISQDESIFYTILKENIEIQSSKWLQKLNLAKRFFLINKKTHSSRIIQLFKNDQLQQIRNLKKQIDQTSKIKEQINYLYSNNLFKNWKSYFQMININRQVINRQRQSYSDQLLNLIEALGKHREFAYLINDQTVKRTNQTSKTVIMTTVQKCDMSTSHEIDSNRQTSNEGGAKQMNPQMKVQPRKNHVFTQKRNRILGRI